jgi:hypothetical protein
MLVFAPDARCLMAGDRVGNPLVSVHGGGGISEQSAV